MKYILLIFLSLITFGCHSVKIKDEKYKVSSTTPELGAVGFSSKDMLLKNQFNPYGMPVLKNKVRLEAHIISFNKDVYNVYKDKYAGKAQKGMPKLVDSTAIKQDYVVFNILDKQTLLSEYNAEYNKRLLDYLKSSGKATVVTSLAVFLTEKDMGKIKAADAFYLTNQLDHKYLVQLFKDGKKTEVIDVQSGTTLAYVTEGFCWDIDTRGNWFPADLNKEGCHGKLEKRIKQKEQTSIYKM